MTNPANVAIASPSSLVSIIIPCCGMLEYTKLCVPSVLRCSPDTIELIFIDIGSLDGTAEYLAGLRDGLANRIRVEVCRAAVDDNISAACKDALKRAHGDYVCLLNNDTVVIPGWVDGMIGLTRLSPAYGMVGPMSNYAAPPQLVETVPYRIGPKKGAHPSDPLVDINAVQRFAHEFRVRDPGKWIQVDRLGGFCLLIRRSVLDRIESKLDEWTNLSLFDTDILSMKPREAGFTLCLCLDLFIHHFGTRTFTHGAPTGS
jgi:GT2 family glycosyltransferase